MKKAAKHILIFVFLVMLAANIYIFVQGIRLSASINTYESEIQKLDLENKDLENKSFQVDSLQYAASVAAQLHFTKDAQPLYIKPADYAFRQ